MKKRLICLSILLAISFAFTGCGQSKNINDTNTIETTEPKMAETDDNVSTDEVRESESQNDADVITLNSWNDLPDVIKNHPLSPAFKEALDTDSVTLESASTKGTSFSISYSYKNEYSEVTLPCKATLYEITLPTDKTYEELLDTYRNGGTDYDSYLFMPPVDSTPSHDEGINSEYRFSQFYVLCKGGNENLYDFTYDGIAYRIIEEIRHQSATDSSHPTLFYWDIRNFAGYTYEPSCSFETDSAGNETNIDEMSGKYFYLRKTGFDKSLRLNAITTGTDVGEYDSDEMNISLYWDDDTTPFQTIKEYSCDFTDPTRRFTFEDFNCDGIDDITIMDGYGANGGDAFHYVYCPSAGQFTKCSSELEPFSGYDMNKDLKLLRIYYHGSAITNDTNIYHWTGENSFELVSSISTDYTDDDSISARITLFDDSKEEILSDCTYERDYYEEHMDEIYALSCDQIIWDSKSPVSNGQNNYRVFLLKKIWSFEEDTEDSKYTIYLLNDDTSYYGSKPISIISEIEDISVLGNGSKDASLAIRSKDGTDLTLSYPFIE